MKKKDLVLAIYDLETVILKDEIALKLRNDIKTSFDKNFLNQYLT